MTSFPLHILHELLWISCPIILSRNYRHHLHSLFRGPFRFSHLSRRFLAHSTWKKKKRIQISVTNLTNLFMCIGKTMYWLLTFECNHSDEITSLFQSVLNVTQSRMMVCITVPPIIPVHIPCHKSSKYVTQIRLSIHMSKFLFPNMVKHKIKFLQIEGF